MAFSRDALWFANAFCFVCGPLYGSPEVKLGQVSEQDKRFHPMLR
jgi:hypothetical protein